MLKPEQRFWRTVISSTSSGLGTYHIRNNTKSRRFVHNCIRMLEENVSGRGNHRRNESFPSEVVMIVKTTITQHVIHSKVEKFDITVRNKQLPQRSNKPRYNNQSAELALNLDYAHL